MAATRVRLNAFGESYPAIRIVLGLVGTAVGGYGISYELERYGFEMFEHHWDDPLVAIIIFACGAIILGWGLWRRRWPAQWVEIDRRARTLTVKIDGEKRHTVAIDAVGALEIRDYLYVRGRGSRSRRYCIRAAGLPKHALFDTLFSEKARAQLDVLRLWLLPEVSPEHADAATRGPATPP